MCVRLISRGCLFRQVYPLLPGYCHNLTSQMVLERKEAYDLKAFGEGVFSFAR